MLNIFGKQKITACLIIVPSIALKLLATKMDGEKYWQFRRRTMESITIELNPAKLVNPDLDLRYVIPDKIEELTNGKVKDNGYDYGEHDSLIIFLKSSNCKTDVQIVIEIIKSEIFLGNNIYENCIVSISENDIDFAIVHLIKSEE